MARFGLHSSRVLIDGSLNGSTLIVSGKTIESVEPGLIHTDSFPVEDLGGSVIMPGLIDSHVHINEPGRTDWEGFDTATQAAAAGGITMLVDMPLNSTPVTTNVASLNLKLAAAKNSIHVNCGFYGGVVPDNCKSLDPLIEAGVLGIKAFLTHSGIDDFPNVAEQHLRAALPAIRNSNIPLLVHAELDGPHAGLKELEMNPTSYQAFLKSRPREWEDRAINMLIRLCEETQTRIHIVHLSSSNSIAPLQAAIKKGLPISVETCPHYLVFNSEDIPDGQTLFKCAPPIREKENNEMLWQAIKDNVISFIVTDHSPCLPEMKQLASGNFQKAWGGIAGLQFSLPAFWTQARKRGFSIEQTAGLMSANVARFINLVAVLAVGKLTTFAGRPAAAVGGPDFPGPTAVRRYYQACDGWLAVAATTPIQVAGLLSAVGHPEWAAPDGTGLDDTALGERLSAALATRPVEAWVAALAACEVPACAVLPRAGELAGPFLVENDFSHVVDDPVAGKLRVVRAFSNWPGAHQPSARPPRGTTPGEETAAVLAAAGINLPS